MERSRIGEVVAVLSGEDFLVGLVSPLADRSAVLCCLKASFCLAVMVPEGFILACEIFAEGAPMMPLVLCEAPPFG